MSDRKNLGRYDLVVIIIFLLTMTLLLLPVANGSAWVILGSNQMVFVLTIVAALQLMIAGVVLAYSLVSYYQEDNFRDLILILIAADVILGTLLYLMTNAAYADFSPFADRYRNRTLVATYAFTIAPFVLFGSIRSSSHTTRKQRVISLLWGLVIAPSFSLWFFLSPEPVFITSTD
ncbi:MAG: hypothetical protein ACFE7R_10285, partial [Candidatus Hodarchaeota archaeon]